MASSWRPLPIASARGAQLPPLLLSAMFQSDAYTIYLTDLTNIWSESLTRKAILQRSLAIDASIDPTEADQMPIFMQKIQLGIEGGRNTECALAVSTDAESPTITLTVKIPLPGGLAPLEWPFRLSAEPQKLLTNQLIYPLVRAQHSRMQEFQGLAEIVREKDHCIEKMLDKLEAHGTDLGQIFPQAALKNGRHVGRDKAGEKVKALKRFDIEVWQKALMHEEARDDTPILENVFGSVSSENFKIKTSNANSTKTDVDDKWWEAIRGKSIDLFGKSSKDSARPKAKRFSPSKPEVDEDDDFQVQATPPRLRSPKSSLPDAIDETTDDDDGDLDAAPSQRSKIPDSFPSSLPSPRTIKIGIVGAKKPSDSLMQEDNSSESESKPSPKVKKLGALGKKRLDFSSRKKAEPVNEVEDSTEDESPPPEKRVGALGRKKEKTAVSEDDDSDEVVPKPSKRTVVEPKTRKVTVEAESSSEDQPATKKSLGAIGLKKTTTTAEDDTTDDDDNSEPQPKKKGRLGKLGRKKAASPSSTDGDDDASPEEKQVSRGKKKDITPSPSTMQNSPDPGDADKYAKATVGDTAGTSTPAQRVKRESTPEVEETAEEKADKKRAQLKRALEQKSKMPVKKKKKF